MRTTIVVDGGAATSPTAPGATSAAAAIDAGAGPAADADGASIAPSGLDGGRPPAWLIDQITEAGGMTAPASPEGIELAGRDGGPAPRS